MNKHMLDLLLRISLYNLKISYQQRKHQNSMATLYKDLIYLKVELGFIYWVNDRFEHTQNMNLSTERHLNLNKIGHLCKSWETKMRNLLTYRYKRWCQLIKIRMKCNKALWNSELAEFWDGSGSCR